MSSLLRYDAACQAVAEAASFDEIRDWEDKAAAIREYSRRARNLELELDALAIRERARRRRGELLLLLREQGELGTGRPKTVERTRPFRTTLEMLGVTRDESSRDQKIASLTPERFEQLLAACRAEAGKSRPAMVNVLNAQRGFDKKERRRQKELDLANKQKALPKKRYGVILADPPWFFKPYSEETGMDRAADNHYPTSAIEQIKLLDVPSLAAKDCCLFLWATAPMLIEALDTMEAWGFTYKTNMVWDKQTAGTGFWFRNRHELLLLGTRGNVPAPAMGEQEESLLSIKKAAHSAKPEAFLKMIEGYFPNLPKIELYRRGSARKDWDCWGLEAE